MWGIWMWEEAILLPAFRQEEIVFWLLGELIRFNPIDSNGPSCTCNISSNGTALVFFVQKSTLCWIKLSADYSEKCDTLLIASEPDRVKVLFTHLTYSHFPAWAWCHPLDDVLHQKILMCSSLCHMLWNWKMTCCIRSFSGVQGREDKAPAINICDFWWYAPR